MVKNGLGTCSAVTKSAAGFAYGKLRIFRKEMRLLALVVLISQGCIKSRNEIAGRS